MGISSLIFIEDVFVPDDSAVASLHAGEFTVFGALPRSRHVVEQPFKFGARKIGINHEPRFATVTAAKDCELIEIPFGTLDIVLFTKPAWAKALVMTLSKRLRNAFKS